MFSLPWSLITPYLFGLLRLFISAILLSSAIGKIKQLRNFSNVVAEYKLLPKRIVRPFAYILPFVEGGIGLFLFVGWYTQVAAGLVILLMLIFTMAIIVNLARGRRDLDCGCSGEFHRDKIGGKVVIRDILLILFSLQLVLWGGGFMAFDNLSRVMQQFIFEIIFARTLLPLILISIGLYLLSLLMRQLSHLIALIPDEE